jgi:hypothetical protein
MFLGTLPQTAYSMVREAVNAWHPTKLYVACAGNFTIERSLYDLKIDFHSCDVSIYTCTLGWMLAQQDFRLELKPEREDLAWITPYLTGRLEKAATIMLSTRVFEHLPTNAYYRRMFEGWKEQWPTLHALTLKKLEKVTQTFKLASFTAMDALEFVQALPPDAPVISFPPFLGTGGGYEKMWEALNDAYSWDAPEYPLMDIERRTKLIEMIKARDCWCYCVPDDGYEGDVNLHGSFKTTARGAQVYMYASGGRSHLVTANQNIEPVLIPRLLPGDKIGDRLSLCTLPSAQFSALRSQYMNIHIRPAAPPFTAGVVCDGKLIGAFAFDRTSMVWPNVPQPGVYLLSDFPVDPTDYPRLSKLVLVAALSKEAQLLMERALSCRVRALTTTAFSDKEESMKYRSLFKRSSRKENTAEGSKWMLNYWAPAGRWTLQEGLQRWKNANSRRA